MSRLFVSDVHLDTASPEAVEQFLGFLTTHAAGAEALYILGDLFETWIGDDDRDAAKARVQGGLRTLTRSGVACFVLHGNRDFLLGRDFCTQTGCRLLQDPIIADLDGERVLITHGDALCTDDHPYQELRSIVRTPQWQRQFLALPLAVREALANSARAGSQQHTSNTSYRIMDVNPDAVIAAFRVAGVRRIIHGHTHRPGVQALTIEGEPAQRIVLGAWYSQGSYLWNENGRYELRELPRRS
ncbi:MAG TPA: UDP-2,3-diacylglucosamine diphosphatase [Steroidobacteraceae bacterium]|nr:UDP-2,3-diacylglucosamine diphosphatase [Steroidobacteraceae bacterium]